MTGILRLFLVSSVTSLERTLKNNWSILLVSSGVVYKQCQIFYILILIIFLKSFVTSALKRKKILHSFMKHFVVFLKAVWLNIKQGEGVSLSLKSLQLEMGRQAVHKNDPWKDFLLLIPALPLNGCQPWASNFISRVSSKSYFLSFSSAKWVHNNSTYLTGLFWGPDEMHTSSLTWYTVNTLKY